MSLFYDSINLTIRNEETTMFWFTPWLDGHKPKDIAPSILNISKKKKFLVSKGIAQDFWISNLSFEGGITVAHIMEFSILWSKIQEIQVTDEPDTITWKLSASGAHSSSSAYLAQFDDPPTSYMIPTVGKIMPLRSAKHSLG
jgi:hypothetical protein